MPNPTFTPEIKIYKNNTTIPVYDSAKKYAHVRFGTSQDTDSTQNPEVEQRARLDGVNDFKFFAILPTVRFAVRQSDLDWLSFDYGLPGEESQTAASWISLFQRDGSIIERGAYPSLCYYYDSPSGSFWAPEIRAGFSRTWVHGTIEGTGAPYSVEDQEYRYTYHDSGGQPERASAGAYSDGPFMPVNVDVVFVACDPPGDACPLIHGDVFTEDTVGYNKYDQGYYTPEGRWVRHNPSSDKSNFEQKIVKKSVLRAHWAPEYLYTPHIGSTYGYAFVDHAKNKSYTNHPVEDLDTDWAGMIDYVWGQINEKISPLTGDLALPPDADFIFTDIDGGALKTLDPATESPYTYITTLLEEDYPTEE